MDVDSALRLLGRYSRWQIRSYLCCASAFGVAFSWILMTVVFIGDTPNYRCALPPNASVDEWIPKVEKNGEYVYDKCSMYAKPGLDNTTIPCQYGYWYDPESGYDSTISTQWNLVCGKAWLVELSMSMQAVGKIIGALVFNHLSDRYGRKMVFLSCLWINIVIASTRAFSPNMVIYSLLVLIGGAVQQGFVSSSFVMAVELFPTDQRSTAGTVIEMFWALGYMSVALMGYYIRNWRYLELATALPFILTICYYWILSESIPWLVANNRLEEAEEILRKAAKYNNKTLPEVIFKRPPTPIKCWPSSAGTRETLMGLTIQTTGKGDLIVVDDGSTTDDYKPVDEDRQGVDTETTPMTKGGKAAAMAADQDNQEELSVVGTSSDDSVVRYGLKDIFHNRTMLIYSSVLVTLWFVLCLTYNTMGITVTYLPGNRYLNFFLYAVMEIPAYLLTWLLAVRASRRFSLMSLCLAGGVLLLAVTFMDTYDKSKHYWILIVSLNVMGKFMLTTALSLVYVIVPEIFPTNLRNVGMGLCQMFGRFGALIGPFARVLQREIPWVPVMVMSVLSVGAGGLSLLLPETRLLPLPDSIEQVEATREQQKRKCCPSEKVSTLSLPEAC